MPKTNHPYSWTEFRDNRIADLRAGHGRLIWQFLKRGTHASAPGRGGRKTHLFRDRKLSFRQRELPAFAAFSPSVVRTHPVRGSSGCARQRKLVVGKSGCGIHHFVPSKRTDLGELAGSSGPESRHGCTARCDHGLEDAPRRRLSPSTEVRDAARQRVAVVERRRSAGAPAGRGDHSPSTGCEVRNSGEGRCVVRVRLWSENNGQGLPSSSVQN